MVKIAAKPKKPYPDFPLTAHNNGQWCKKIRGKVHFFGICAEVDQALANYCEVRDDLQAGRQPRTTTSEPSLRDVCNAYLTRARQREEAGEISPRTFQDYYDTVRVLLGHFGKSVDPTQIRPTEFGDFRTRIAKDYSSSRLTKTVGVTRMILKWAYESDLIENAPKFGPDFKGASRRAVRAQKHKGEKKLFSATDINSILNHCDTTIFGMVLLGINGGLGNTDISSLREENLDLNAGWINFPRPKTGVDRRIPLWEESVAALKAIRELRPAASKPEFEELVFLTHWGNRWVNADVGGKHNDQLAAKFRKILEAAKLHRHGCGFYWLRHTFQTMGDEAKDPVATAHIMGHVDGSMGSVYRESISDERLRMVVDTVHSWLFK